jgi:Protein of unknown function (DUF3606)
MLAFNRLFGGGGDLKRINVKKDDDLDVWARRLGATKNQVRVAIAAVGDEPDKVDAYLRRRWATRGWDNKAH